jgi:hypothetical protein
VGSLSSLVQAVSREEWSWGHPVTLVGFMEMYPTQDACRRALFEQRRREGFRCPRCAHAVAWYLRGRGLCAGAGCGYQASLTAGTLLHKTSTDLRKWLLAIWLRRRKITQAMRRGEHEPPLRGVVELDESLLGGRGGAHLRLIDDAGAKTLTKAARAQIQPGGAVKTDGWSAYRALPGAAYVHEPHAESTPQAAGELPPSGAHRHPPTSSTGNSTPSLASAPRTCGPASTSSATGLGRRDQRLDLLRRILKRCVLCTPPTTYSQLIAA